MFVSLQGIAFGQERPPSSECYKAGNCPPSPSPATPPPSSGQYNTQFGQKGLPSSECHKAGNCPPSPGPAAPPPSSGQYNTQDPRCSTPPPKQTSTQCLSDCADKRTECLKNSNITGEQDGYGGYKGCLKLAEEAYQRCNKAKPASWACFSQLTYDNASCNTLWLGQGVVSGKCALQALECATKCADIPEIKRCVKSFKDQFYGP